MSLQCTECSRCFTLKSNLTRHLRMIHNVETERVDILPGDFDVYHYKCLEGCNISFKYNRELRKHLKVKHEMDVVELTLEFPNSEEFNKWLYEEETNNYVQYVHLTATKRKSTGGETYYYECSRTGKSQQKNDNVRKRRARKWVAKLNRGCTSQIIVNKSHNDIFSVIYYKTHYGHDIGLEHVKLSKKDRGAIASKLLLGLPVNTVLHSIKNADGDNVKRVNLVGKKDLFNIRRSYNIDLRNGKLANMDVVDINLFLCECSRQLYNPVLYSNLMDLEETDDICIVIMSEYQSKFLKEHEYNIFVLTSTALSNCGFDLVTLFVINESESFPAACMFTNNATSNIYELFFKKIQDRVGTISPKILITNCDEMYHEAWTKTMNSDTSCIYNPCQIDFDLKLNLNRILCVETDVTKIKRKWVYDTMKMLQTNCDESDFLDNLKSTIEVLSNDDDFHNFFEYYSKNYSNPKKWAECYRTGLHLPLSRIAILSDVLKQYLCEEIENRFDKIFHSLIRFIRDETVNAMLKTKTNRTFFVSENDKRHELNKQLFGTHLGDDLWHVSDEDYGTGHVVQKYLDRKCCNLTCTSCNICIHCFSCTCVDFFIANVICVHIHYIWVTYFQSIVSNDDSFNEEIVIEINEEPKDDESGSTDELKRAIIERTCLLKDSIDNLENKDTLKVILDTVNQLCELSSGRDLVEDHSYL